MVDSSANNVTINNKGTIQTNQWNGIEVTGSSTANNINNSGLIQGHSANDQAGIKVKNNSTIQTLTNSGTISGNSGIIVEGNTLNTLTNSGTIVGNQSHGIYLKNGNVSLNNQGLIKSTDGGSNGILLETNNIDIVSISGTFDNSGTIKGIYAGINVNRNATITSLNNTGTIESDNFGVVLWNNGKINTLVNNTNGTIKGQSGIGLLGTWSCASIDTIINKGTIISTGNSTHFTSASAGILVEKRNSVSTIKNEGLIDTKGAGININGNGTLSNLIENSGIIKFTGTTDDTHEGFGRGSGIHVQNINGAPTVETVRNSGTIDAHNGIFISLGSTINNLENSGIIKATKDGIALGNNSTSWEGIQTEVKTITNSGTILADRYGVFIDIANNSSVPFKIGEINLSGLIRGGVAGLYIDSNQKLTENINVSGTLTGGTAGIINKGTIGTENNPSQGGIKLNSGGTIGAFGSSYFRAGVGPAILNTDNGIIYGDTKLNNNSKLIGGVVNNNNGKLIGNIIVKDGSSITGGIINADNGVVTGSIILEGTNSQIEGGITNSGNGTISGDITIGNGSKVDFIENSGNGTVTGGITNSGNLDFIANSGNIGGGITNNSSSNISISNQGIIKPNAHGNHITNNGSGNIIVEDWVVSTDTSGKVETINVGGNQAHNTIIDKVTVNTNGNLDLDQAINPESLIQNTNSGTSMTSGSIQLGNNPNSAIALYKDPRTGKYVFAVNAGASIASMMLQTIVDQTSRRSLMIDTLMDQSAYKFHHWNKKSSKNGIEPKENIDGFFLPYRSYNKIALSDNAGISSGHTTGYIAGFNALKDDGIYGVYLGTENNNFNNADVFDLDTKAYYGGVKFSNILKTGPYYDVVLGTHLKAAVLKNDLTRFIEKPNNASLTSKGKTDSYTYGVNANLAINYYLSDKTAITPAVGLGYEGGHTKAFSMVGDAAFDHERYYSNTLNLIQTKASLKWFQIWNDKISTIVEGGARFNLNDTLDSTVNFNGGKYTGSVDLPRVYGYSNFSFIYSLTKNLDLSLNYNGIASDNSGQTHTGYLEFNFKY